MSLVALDPLAPGEQNAATLQAAIDAGPRAVELDQGTFPCAPVTLRPGVAVIGKSPHATRLRAVTANAPVLSRLVGATERWFEVSRIGFDVSGVGGAVGIKIDGNTSAMRASQVRLLDLDFDGPFTRAVHLRYCCNVYGERLWISNGLDGIRNENSGDVDLVSCKVQNGNGIGFHVIGGPGAFDEGVRLVDCSTNTQAQGLIIDGQEWGLATGCSFTTAPLGAMRAVNACANWSFSACDFSVAGSNPGLTANAIVDAGCSGFSFEGCQFLLGQFGLVLRGLRHSATGNKLRANSNVDIYLDGCQRSAVAGNSCDSDAVPWSILEANGATKNACAGNVTNGVVSVVGAVGNVVY